MSDVLFDEVSRCRQEITRLTREIERLTLDGIHSCHAECQRPVCRLTRERDALLEALRLVQVDCQYLHHEKEDQHALSQTCPVVDRINAAIKVVEEGK